jgi:shikimate kinase
MMGSGKTTIGRELSRRTGWAYHDNDALLKKATGRSAKQLADEGQQRLREAEGEALHHALTVPAPAIVASAAGVVQDDHLRNLLKDSGMVVWLRAPAEMLARRTEGGDHRPWLDEDPVAWLRATSARRGPLYRDVADITVDTADRTPAEVAREIQAWLRTTGCARWMRGEGLGG